MPALKSDIYITVRCGDKQFSIGAVELPNNRYAIKRGRSWSEKMHTATLSEVFTQARKWVVRQKEKA